MNDAYESTLGLRAVRRFRDEPLSEEDLTRILEAGRWTGSSKNRQPWVFVVVEERERLVELSQCGQFAGPVAGAALAIVPVIEPEGYQFDAGRVAQNMMLAAAAIGVGSVPVTLYEEDRVRELLGIPSDHRARYAVAFGYPARDEEQAQRRLLRASGMTGRKDVADIVRRERFDG